MIKSKKTNISTTSTIKITETGEDMFKAQSNITGMLLMRLFWRLSCYHGPLFALNFSLSSVKFEDLIICWTHSIFEK